MLESSPANLVHAKTLWAFNMSVDIMNFGFEFLGFASMKSFVIRYRYRSKSVWPIRIKIR